MIIHSLNKEKIKIIIDEVDLNKAEIPISEWISNSSKTLSYIEHLLKYTTNFPEELVLKDYFIYTYNFKVFSIILLL